MRQNKKATPKKTTHLKAIEKKLEKPELSGFGKRIEDIRKALGISQLDMAAALNITYSYLSSVKHNHYKPGYEFLYNIFTKFNVNIHYLMTGKGEMFNPIELEDIRPTGSITDGKNLLWYMERSPLFMLLVLGHASKTLYDNKTNIDNEIEAYEVRHNQKN